MSYNLKDFEKRDIYKSLIYKLCDFLIERRQNPKYEDSGLARPIIIPLKEMNGLLEYSHPSTKEAKIKELGKVLKHLNEDYIKRDNKNTVINILNSKLLKNFVTSYNNNKKIIIGCSVEELEEYKSKLRKMTEENNIVKSPSVTEEKFKILNIISKKYKHLQLIYKDKKGFLKIKKKTKWIDLGGYNTRTFRMVKYITSPAGESKKVCDVFEQIRIRKDRANEDLEKETARTYPEQKKIIRNAVAELQKKKFLKGYLNSPKFDEAKKEVTITFK